MVAHPAWLSLSPLFAESGNPKACANESGEKSRFDKRQKIVPVQLAIQGVVTSRCPRALSKATWPGSIDTQQPLSLPLQSLERPDLSGPVVPNALTRMSVTASGAVFEVLAASALPSQG